MDSSNNTRELFASRLGFILMTAGCAIGLGNVWRFPYVAGQYGGGFFLLLYLIFLIIMGFPVMLMELALGRASRCTYPGAYRLMQNPQGRFRWQVPGHILFCGNLILLMFYSVITGWLFIYAGKYICGSLQNLAGDTPQNIFGNMLAAPVLQAGAMILAMALTVLVCAGGLRKTIERSIKIMMGGLFILLIILVIQSLRLPNAVAGIEFFLKPDWNNFIGNDIFGTIHAAMAQAFFTLSLGIGSVAVCGSYMPKNSSLAREGIWIIALDTFVAVASGLIIFPACAAFNIKPDAGPSLIFITLPRVFDSLPAGRFWGLLFFIFLAIAAFSTLVAVFENLVAFGMDQWKWSRRKSCAVYGLSVTVLSLPCILGFNIWQKFQPFGKGSNVLDLEDFIVSDNLLPLGALCLTVFCMNRFGWGKENFFAEVNTGCGLKVSGKLAGYMRYVLPAIILCIWLTGLFKRFGC